jgi:ribonuclease T1
LLALCAIATRDAAARADAPAAVAISALPAEARTTLDLIRAGGPFPYSRDGVVFSNRERLLPAQPRGYYHEYTVPTPGAGTRGARRIVCGGDVAARSECYYSDDHYQSFRKIQR